MKKPKKLKTAKIVKKSNTTLDKYLKSMGIDSISQHPLIVSAFARISKDDDIVSEDFKDWQQATLLYGELIEEFVSFMGQN